MPPQEPPSPALAAAVRRLREGKGLTQEEVAFQAGMSVGAYARVDQGKANPTWTTVERIARALDIGLGELGEAVEAEG